VLTWCLESVVVRGPPQKRDLNFATVHIWSWFTQCCVHIFMIIYAYLCICTCRHVHAYKCCKNVCDLHIYLHDHEQCATVNMPNLLGMYRCAKSDIFLGVFYRYDMIWQILRPKRCSGMTKPTWQRFWAQQRGVNGLIPSRSCPEFTMNDEDIRITATCFFIIFFLHRSYVLIISDQNHDI